MSTLFVRLKLKQFKDWNFGEDQPRLPSDVSDAVSSNMNGLEKNHLRVTSRSFCYGFEETAQLVCEKAGGVFMYASEVLRQLKDDPMLDLNGLPQGLAELYMTRYEKTFPEDDDVDQFAEHSGPMLAMLVASRGPLSVKVVRHAGVDAKVKQKGSWKEKRRRHLEFVKTMCVGSLVDVGLLQFSHKSFSDWLLNKKKN